MKEVLIKEYSNLRNLKLPFRKEAYVYKINFVKGAYCEILGDTPGNFLVQFINRDNGKVIFSDNITNNMWTKCSYGYYINWEVRVTDTDTNEVIYQYYYNAQEKRVYIHLDSRAIGDTLAWFPYTEEFAKKHNCKVVVSTFHNEWFESQYPEIEFVKPGTPVENIYAMYTVGWHYDENGEVNKLANPNDFKKYGLQECSADILGLDFKEIKPRLSFNNTGSVIEGDYVVIAPHASAHAKYWNFPGGWQWIVDYFNNRGIKVVMITQEKLGDTWHDSKLGGTLRGVIDKTGNYPLSNRANDIMNAQMFIGVGSGLSWLSWALGTSTVLISGFSAPFSEFTDCERVFTPSSDTCNSCYNKFRLDAGDWEWCPEHKGTDRQFECTKSIHPDMVFEAIERIKKF